MVYLSNLMLVLVFLLFQGGHRVTIEAVSTEEAYGEHGKITYHTKGKFSIEPFDVKDRDAYVLLLTNASEKLMLHNFEKFSFRDVSRTSFNWSYSFTIDVPEEDFSIYAILVDRFNDDLFEQYQKDVNNMMSVEQVIGKLRKENRVDPLNFNLYYVRVN